MSSTQPPQHYDAVVVGARAAGAATALLLARAGLHVLVVDRSRYGDDTLSTHALMRGGVLQLHRWGLLPAVVSAGTPPVRHTTVHVGAERVEVAIKPSHGIDALYAPRRTVLDRLIVDAAVAEGADVRFGTTVTGLRRTGDGRVTGIEGHDGDGRPVSASADITVGADGMSSAVARWVEAPVQRMGTSAGAVVYGYWPGVARDGYEWFFRRGGAAGVIPTNDDQSCVFVGTTPERFRRDLVHSPGAGYLALLADVAPEIAGRLADAPRPVGLHRFGGRPGFFRQPHGPGWALVGDAGYFKDPITAHGLTDALRDAELLARAIIEGRRDGDAAGALAGYEATRNRLSAELFTITDSIASHRGDPATVGSLLRALSSSMNEEVEALASLDDALVDGARPVLAR